MERSRLIVFVVVFLSFFLPIFISWVAGGWVARYYSPPFSPTDIPDLTGKTAIVTGANTGIGYSTALELARKGAKVVIGCRSDERGRDAEERIKQELKGLPGADLVKYMKLDLSSFKSVKEFASSFRAKYYSVDMLILNAAVIMNSYDETENGFEAQIGTNHLGHFLLVKLLLPMIRYSKTRVVHVSSASHMDSYPEGIRFSTWRGSKDSYSRFYAYGQSKLANVLFSNQLATKLNGSGATSNVLHPGIIATDGQRHLKKLLNSNPFSQILLMFLQTLWNAAVLSVNDGALTQLFVATSPSLEGVTGRYYIPIGLDRTHATSPHARNVTLANLLWKESEKYLAAAGY